MRLKSINDNGNVHTSCEEPREYAVMASLMAAPIIHKEIDVTTKKSNTNYTHYTHDDVSRKPTASRDDRQPMTVMNRIAFADSNMNQSFEGMNLNRLKQSMDQRDLVFNEMDFDQ